MGQGMQTKIHQVLGWDVDGRQDVECAEALSALVSGVAETPQENGFSPLDVIAVFADAFDACFHFHFE